MNVKGVGGRWMQSVRTTAALQMDAATQRAVVETASKKAKVSARIWGV